MKFDKTLLLSTALASMGWGYTARAATCSGTFG